MANDLFFITSEPHQEEPNGFYNAFGKTGMPLDLGFHCRRCHLVYPCNAPKTISHCGRKETLDPNTRLRDFRMGGGSQVVVFNPNVPRGGDLVDYVGANKKKWN